MKSSCQAGFCAARILALWYGMTIAPTREDGFTRGIGIQFCDACGNSAHGSWIYWLDIVFDRAFAWRVAYLEYTHAWLGDVDQIHAANGVRVTSGLILRVGTW